MINWIATNILQNPPILLGLIAALGLAIQKKPFADIIKGSLTAAFGMLILTEGVNMLTGIISSINTTVQTQMGLSVSKGLSDISFTADYGGAVGMAMFFGLIIHLLIARFTPVKTIFLTGRICFGGFPSSLLPA